MQTEIDYYLAEQNELLSQQNAFLMQENSSLKTTLDLYKKLQQDLNNKISNLEEENETRKELISQMKLEFLKLEQGNFSADFQQKLIANFSTQYQKLWMKVSEDQDLVNMLKNIVQTELKDEKTQLKTSSLEGVADACTTGLQRRNRNINLLGKRLKDTNEECHELAREFDRLATEIRKIRLKPKPATDFKYLRR